MLIREFVLDPEPYILTLSLPLQRSVPPAMLPATLAAGGRVCAASVRGLGVEG